MLEKFIFENHLGQRFEGLPNGVYLNYNDLRDYSWSYDTINNRISRFYMGARNRKLPLVVYCKSDDEAVAVKNRLHELAEADIEAIIPGKIFVGDYYTNGYITASTKSNYLINKRLCNIELTLTSDDPAWYREQTHTFIPGTDGSISIGGTDYKFDYPYDYAQILSGSNVVCDSVCASAFKILIYGPANDPEIIIGGHKYAVSGSVGIGETLLIDSLQKKITLTTAQGKNLNWFSNRFKENYIFDPIPAGIQPVYWSGLFGFDLTIIEKRREPRWT